MDGVYGDAKEKLRRSKVDAAKHVAMIRARVDPGSIRGKQTDRWGDIKARMEAAEK